MMSVEKMYPSGEKMRRNESASKADLEAQYKGLGCAAVRAATAIKPIKKPKPNAAQMAASILMDSD